MTKAGITKAITPDPVTDAEKMIEAGAHILRMSTPAILRTCPAALAERIYLAMNAARSNQEATPDAALLKAGNELADKLWILRCDSRDALSRAAAEKAINMWNAALAEQGVGPDPAFVASQSSRCASRPYRASIRGMVR